MPRFTPFAGYRYDPARVDLAAVIAPPYDVVGPTQRTVLAARHPANAIHVELPEPDPRSGVDRYRAAATLLGTWIADGLLVRDPGPVFYGYRMTPPDGAATGGVIGVLGLDDASAAATFPHERTLPRAKSDRINLLSATRFNLSPIWGLTLARGLDAHLEPARASASAADDDGVNHELWSIAGAEAIGAVAALVGSAPLVVADGHHRLSTAAEYRLGAGAGTQGSDGILAFVVELAEDQLSVAPIHRLLVHLPDGLDLVGAFATRFEVSRIGELEEPMVADLARRSVPALLLRSGCWLLQPKDGTTDAAGSDLWPAMVDLVLDALPDQEVAFANSWSEATTAVSDHRADGTVLLPPVQVDQIRAFAEAGIQMPPKSTYFQPKPRTGMVFRALDLP